MRISDWSSDVCSSDLLAQAPLPLTLVALAKTLAHWLSTGLPLAVIAPLLAILMQMEPSAIPVLLLALLLGTPSLSLIGAIGAALTLGARQIGRAHVELQSLMRISSAVFCLKNTKQQHDSTKH